MKHHAHFGLEHDPFVNRPSLDDWVGTPVHDAAECRLRRAIEQGKALSLLVGEPGSGKTMLVRRLLDGLDDARLDPCAIAWMPGESGRLLARLARQLGAEEGADRTQTLGRIYERLIEVHSAGRRVVVMLDGADAMTSRADLDDVRALLGFEHEEGALLVLVLVGTAALDATIDAEPRLRDRVEVRVVLQRLDAEGMREYVIERFRRANGDPTDIEPEAMVALHGASRGLPRLVNTIADNALFEACQRGSRRVSAADVGLAARELRIEGVDLEELTHPRERVMPPAASQPAPHAASTRVLEPPAVAIRERAASLVAPLAGIAGTTRTPAPGQDDEMTFAGLAPMSAAPDGEADGELMGGYELPSAGDRGAVMMGEALVASDDLDRAFGDALDANELTSEDADVLELSQPILDGELAGGDEAEDAAVVLDVAGGEEPGFDLEGLVEEGFEAPPKDEDGDDLFAELVIDESR